MFSKFNFRGEQVMAYDKFTRETVGLLMTCKAPTSSLGFIFTRMSSALCTHNLRSLASRTRNQFITSMCWASFVAFV